MPTSQRSFGSILSLLALVMFSVAFVFSIGGASSRVMQSFHGLHHGAYVYQVALGTIAPTNPSSIEMPANFYWMWHAWLAAGVRVFDVTPFEMSLVSNALGLAGFLCALWLATGEYTHNPWLRIAVCGVPFFVLNPLGLAQFAVRLAWVWVPEMFRTSAGGESGLFEYLVSIARHHSSLQMVDHSLGQLFPRLGLFEGVVLSDRAGHVLNKFLNFNSFPLALAFFAAAQWALLVVRSRPLARASGLAIATFCMAVLSPLPAAAFGLTVLAFAVVEGLPLLARYRVSGALPQRESLWSFAAPIVGSGLGVLLALPHLLPVASAYQGRVLLLTPATGLWLHAVSLGWPLLPALCLLVIAGGVHSRLPSSAKVYALSTLFYGLAAIALVAPQRDPNEYKFVLLSAFPSSLLLLALGRTLASYDSRRLLHNKRLVCAASFTLAAAGALSISIVALLYVASPWAVAEPLVFEGTTTRLRSTGNAELRDLDAAYAWLRNSTPTTAYVFEAPASKDDSRLSVVAQRRVVAHLASPFTRAIGHHEQLLEANRALVGGLAACEVNTPLLEALRDVPVQWPHELYALVQKKPGLGDCNMATAPGLGLEYSNASYAVYRLRL